MLKILITGKYAPEYNRNKILIDGIRERSDIEIVEFPYKKKRKVNKQKLKAHLAWADLVFLPSFTHLDVHFIRKKTTKPIVFDPLVSRYLTKVFDYKKVWRYSPRALKNYLKDAIAFKYADLILADTQAHKQYFMHTFGVKPEKIEVLYIGINPNDFKPLEQQEQSKFIVGFYGSFIPLQGTSNIVEAAKLLSSHKDIHFDMVGAGFEYEQIKKKALNTYQLSNISFTGRLDYNALAQRITQHQICLGIFGDTQKADLVIPNKVYHYAGVRKPIISKDSPAIRELFTPEENIWLCSTKPQDIAANILRLKEDKPLRERLANNAYSLITKDYNQHKIAEHFVSILRKKIAIANR